MSERAADIRGDCVVKRGAAVSAAHRNPQSKLGGLPNAGETPATQVLVIGYGNPGRQDDALGPALAAAVEAMGLAGVTVDSNYQLTVEDADNVARHRVAIFADADTTGPAPFTFRKIQPRTATSFSSHRVEPEAVLGLARELFGAQTEGYVLGIRGYEFEPFVEQLTPQAGANLAAAIEFIRNRLHDRRFDDVLRGGSPDPPRRASRRVRKPAAHSV